MNPKLLSPYSKIRLSRMGQYDEPHRFSQAQRKEMLHKLMAKRVTYDNFGNVVEPVSPGFEDDNVKFMPLNISFSPGEKSIQSSPGQFSNMNLNETDWESRSFSPIPFLLDDNESVRSSPLQEFNFKSPKIRASTPVIEIPPFMENKSVQLSPVFVAQNDYFKENHWKILAFEYLNVELFSILQSYGVDLDVRIQYSPAVLIERVWELLSKMTKEKLRIENEALNNTSIRDFGGKIENLNRSVLSQLYETEKQLMRQKRVNARDRNKVIKYKTRLTTAMANFAFPVHRDLEKKALAQLKASQEVVAILKTELQFKRERNLQLEKKVLAMCGQIAEVQAGCAQELTEAAQVSALGEEAIESAITSYMEKATQFSPQVLSPSEWHEIASEAVKNMRDNFDLNERTIKNLENEIIMQNKTLNAMEAERLKMKDKIYDLDLTLRQQQAMIRMYEAELEPAGREIREWLEYAARKDGPPADPAWSPFVPNPYEAFAPEEFSSPLPADQAFREVKPRRIFSLRSPEPVYVSPLRSPMQHINRAKLMASPARVASPQYAVAPVASPRYMTAAPVQVTSPQYATTPPVASPQYMASSPVRMVSPQYQASPGAQLSPYMESLLEDVSLPSGISCLSDSPPVVSPVSATNSPKYQYYDIRNSQINMSDIDPLFSPLGDDSMEDSPDFRASTPVLGPMYGAGGLFSSNVAERNAAQVNQSVLLHSPYRVAPVQLDVSVQPRPLQQTQSGEHVVCDISLNMEDLAAKRR